MPARVASTERVLIIDDDLMSREVLSLLLETAGHRVAIAASGDAAVAQLQTASPRPTLILTDMQMPGLSGTSLAQALRRICSPDTLLIAMSGSGPESPAVTSAYDCFLLKPFRISDLEAAIASCRKAHPTRPEMPAPVTPAVPPPASNQTMSTNPHASQGPFAVPQGNTHELDERIYRQLGESMPGVQLHQMYAMCLEDVRKRITAMRSFADKHDSDQFIRQAHAIKGGCGMLGASELYRLAAQLEATGPPATKPQAGPGVNPLDELWAACDRLERILGSRT